MLYVLVVLQVFMVSDSIAQETVTYHQVITGFSDARPVLVERWNANKSDQLIRETVDAQNRVVMLEFLRDGQLTEHGFFPVARVTYSYEDHRIIETAYNKDGTNIYVDKYAAHYQSVYHLDKNNYITKVERISDFATVDPVWEELEIERPSLAELQQESKEYQAFFFKDKPLEVEFYRYSYHKLNGLYPIDKNFELESNYESQQVFSLMEQEIRKGILKLKNEMIKD